MTTSGRFRNRALPLALATALIVAVAIFGIGNLSSADSAAKTGPPPAAMQANGPSPDENYLWRPVAIGGGGFISGISFDARGLTKVARADVHGAYIWSVERDRWELLVTATSMPPGNRMQNGANEGVYEIVVAPSDPNRLYMALKGNVYRSSDRGAHWVRSPDTKPFPVAFDPNSPFRFYGPFIAVDPENPDLVFFGTPQDGVWRSENGGRSWASVRDLPLSEDKRPAPGIQAPGASLWFELGKGGKATGRIWAAVPGKGMFVSHDKGQRFTPLGSAGQPSPTSVKQGTFSPDGSFFAVDAMAGKLWRYRDGTWTDLTRAARMGKHPYAAIAANPRDGALYLFDEGAGILRSTNGGESWWPIARSAAVGFKDPPWLHVSNSSYFATGTIQFDPVQPDRLWIAAGTGVYYSDAPSTAVNIVMTSQARGIEELVANDVVQPNGQSPLFAAWDFGIHVKDDLNRFSSTYGPRERVVIAAQQLAWSPADPRQIVTNASDTRMFCCSEDGESVLAGYSQDGGRSWSRFATLPTPPGTKGSDPWRMAFGMIAVAAQNPANIIWAPSFNRSLFYTRDRGKTWARVVLPGETLPFTGSHPAYHFARKTLAADNVAPEMFYFVHSGGGANAALQGLWRTEDGGANWTRVFKGEIAPSSAFAAKLRVVPRKTGHLFFTSAVANGPDTRLRRSSDGGRTWTALNGVDHVDDVAFGKAAKGSTYPTIFISAKVKGQYGLWRSTDSAISWQRLVDFPLGRLDQISVMGADPDVFGRVYIGYIGSGWIYGEPARCTPNPDKVDAQSQCVPVQTIARKGNETVAG